MRINGGIRASKIRLVDDANNQVGIVDRNVGIEMAQEAGLDLVEVAPNSEPPVCRLMDYGKFLYEQKRKDKESRKKTQVTTLKEIRLRPETDTHDLETKMSQAKKFLGKGNKVQFTMFFRGRQIIHQDRGYNVFDRIIEELEEVAKVERPSKLTGKRMILVMTPK